MSLPSLAFFGATGGCANSTLAQALNNGYKCIAQARTPTKLSAAVEGKVNPERLHDLQIVQGDAKNVEDVKKALVLDGHTVDVIVVGVGSLPRLQFSLFNPVTLMDPTICLDAGAVLLQALSQLQSAKSTKKPRLIYISTTGIPPPGAPRDVPLVYLPLYKWLLHIPHEDKRQLEELLRAHVKGEEERKVIDCWTAVKPSLLFDGTGSGFGSVRGGWDAQPAIGWGIKREDVGEWIFERLIREDVREYWRNGSASLTN